MLTYTVLDRGHDVATTKTHIKTIDPRVESKQTMVEHRCEDCDKLSPPTQA